ncbi:ribosome-binding protein aMBF1 (putative translation factor) [Bradyrhizobium japonicum]
MTDDSVPHNGDKSEGSKEADLESVGTEDRRGSEFIPSPSENLVHGESGGTQSGTPHVDSEDFKPNESKKANSDEKAASDDPPDPPKRPESEKKAEKPAVGEAKTLSNLEKFQVAVGIVVSIATALIGWQTFKLDERVKESNSQLKIIEQQLAETKFGFERIKDIYDRTEKYLSAEKQDERRGRALVVLINSLPASTIRSDLLQIVVREAASPTVASTAADAQQGKAPERKDIVSPSLGSSKFIGKSSFRFLEDGRGVQAIEGFQFQDSKGVLWEVPRGQVTDGAAIPRSLWSVVGSPLSGEFIASSALLDRYTADRTRPREQVLQMYREALIASGVSEVKATLFYNAVSSFGPNWTQAK